MNPRSELALKLAERPSARPAPTRLRGEGHTLPYRGGSGVLRGALVIGTASKESEGETVRSKPIHLARERTKT